MAGDVWAGVTEGYECIAALALVATLAQHWYGESVATEGSVMRWMRVVCAGVSVVALGCSSIGEGIANQVLEDQGVSVDLDGESVTVDTPDGSFTAGSGLPEGFPADFPLPEGAEVAGGVSGIDQYDVVVSFMVPGGVAQSADFYRVALPAAGYKIDNELSGTDRSNAVFEISGNGVSGQVILNPAVNATQLAVTLDLLQ